MGSPGERVPEDCQPAPGPRKVCIILCSALMELVLTYLRPRRLCRTIVLGITHLSPHPTGLFIVVALCMVVGFYCSHICGRLVSSVLFIFSRLLFYVLLRSVDL